MCTSKCVAYSASSVLLHGRAQFESQQNSARKSRKGKRVLEARDSGQPLLVPTPSESEVPGEL